MKQRTPYNALLEMANKVSTIDESISVRQTLNFALEFCKEFKTDEAMFIHNILQEKDALYLEDMRRCFNETV